MQKKNHTNFGQFRFIVFNGNSINYTFKTCSIRQVLNQVLYVVSRGQGQQNQKERPQSCSLIKNFQRTILPFLKINNSPKMLCGNDHQ